MGLLCVVSLGQPDSNSSVSVRISVRSTCLNTKKYISLCKQADPGAEPGASQELQRLASWLATFADLFPAILTPTGETACRRAHAHWPSLGRCPSLNQSLWPGLYKGTGVHLELGSGSPLGAVLPLKGSFGDLAVVGTREGLLVFGGC